MKVARCRKMGWEPRTEFLLFSDAGRIARDCFLIHQRWEKKAGESGCWPKKKALQDLPTGLGRARMQEGSPLLQWEAGPRALGQGWLVPPLPHWRARGCSPASPGCRPQTHCSCDLSRNMAARKSNTQPHLVDQRNVFWRHCLEDLWKHSVTISSREGQ